MRRAAIPSPTADPSCLVDPERTSPAAKTPGIDVSIVGAGHEEPSAVARPPRHRETRCWASGR